MQSRKHTKILVLGGPKDALHGVRRLLLYLSLIILISGCSLFADKRRVVVKVNPEPVDNIQQWIDNRNKWMTLAFFAEKHFDTTGWTRKEIATELSLAEYLLNKEVEETVVANPK